VKGVGRRALAELEDHRVGEALAVVGDADGAPPDVEPVVCAVELGAASEIGGEPARRDRIDD
jgi:hypothetical protein